MKLIDYKYFLSKKIESFNFIGYPTNLYKLINYNLSIKGKLVRPILCIISYSFFKNDFRKITNYALALELIHNSLLIYDDIMDDAYLRRGYKTIHKKFGNNQAILLANSLLMKSYKLFNTLDPIIFKDVIYEISYMIMKICEGQQMDINFEKLNNINIKEYLNMIRKKTAVFIGSSLRIGAIIGESSKKNSYLLYNIGIYIGIAYQIQDDLLNILNNYKNIGKKNYTDIISNKKTILYVKALKYANKSQKEELLYWYNIKNFSLKKIYAVKKIFNDLLIIEKIKQDIKIYKKNSLLILNKMKISCKEKKQALVDLINEII